MTDKQVIESLRQVPKSIIKIGCAMKQSAQKVVDAAKEFEKIKWDKINDR